ncbi:MAG: FHA domain-containing protein [Ardenticatenaceae bacterium]|nr:FHA domain-containing protein [Ardenticatenaceae bacterium]
MLLIFALRILFLLLLYGFLGLLVYLIWRDLKARSRPAGHEASTIAQVPRGPRLTVIASGETGLPEGRQYPMGSITTLGRDLANDITIADSFASSRHARIEQREGRFWLEDLGSTNGTHLNGAQLAPYDPVPLDPGDVISIGQTRFKVG